MPTTLQLLAHIAPKLAGGLLGGDGGAQTAAGQLQPLDEASRAKQASKHQIFSWI